MGQYHLYAPQDKAITILRAGASASQLKIKFNFLWQSTRLWNANGYSRPRFMASDDLTEQVPFSFFYVHNELPAVMPTNADTLPLDGATTWHDPTSRVSDFIKGLRKLSV